MHLTSVLLCTAAMFAMMTNLAYAEYSCCYQWTQAGGKYIVRVSWYAATQQAYCAVSVPGTVAACHANTGVSGNTQYMYVNANAEYTDGNGVVQTIAWHFGMNNNQCKFLHDDQVHSTITTTDPRIDLFHGDNVAAQGLCYKF